jgi:hypothetical protein
VVAAAALAIAECWRMHHSNMVTTAYQCAHSGCGLRMSRLGAVCQVEGRGVSGLAAALFLAWQLFPFYIGSFGVYVLATLAGRLGDCLSCRDGIHVSLCTLCCLQQVTCLLGKLAEGTSGGHRLFQSTLQSVWA